MTLTPRPYQLVGRDFLAGRTRALLADEMRVGKTPQAILAEAKLGAKSALVLCPAIAVPHWEREWLKWFPLLDAYPMPTIDVLSYDRARILWSGGSDFKNKRWDVMIVDEAHFCKNPEATRTQMVYGKKGLGYQVGAIWSLSGTPAPKHAGELWPMLRAFGVVGMAYEDFMLRYCYYPKGQPVDIRRPLGTRADRIPELRELLAKVMLRRTRKEVAPDMPDIDFQFLEVEPVRGGDLVVPPGLSDEQMFAWLEQHAGADSEDRQAVAMAKVDPLVENITFAIENGLLKQTVVFGWHVEPLEWLQDRLLMRGISCHTITGQTSQKYRELAQDLFRQGKVQVIAANSKAAGTAIDLSPASHGYFLELAWVPGDNMQAANRLVSMEKEEPVTFDVCTWPGSTDDRVQRVLMRRVNEINQLI